MKKYIEILCILVLYTIGLVLGWKIGECIFKKECKYTSSDVETIQNYCLGKITLSESELTRLDINKDNEVDLLDAVLILKEINKTGC